MGLFDFLKKKKETENDFVTCTSTSVNKEDIVTQAANLEKTNYESSQGLTINLSKHTENLNTVLVDLSKNLSVDLSKHTARVAMAIDYSGSMDGLYNSGAVQKIITRLLPIALKFDDNGELESWIFSNSKEKLDAVTIHNYKDYVKKNIRKASMSMGGTNYAPVLKDIIKLYKDKEPSTTPAFVLFITDGDNWDTSDTERVIRELSDYNMFIQFVGIGNESFNFLRKLDNLSGISHDNTGFISVKDMNKLSDEELYTKLLKQYRDWLNNK